MRPNFFIFSLPRSGTSWLSVFLTGPDSYCFHEPTADFTPAEWLNQAESRPERIVGGIDTGAYAYAERIISATPEADYFALYRDPLEINRSGRALGMGFYGWEKEYNQLKALKLEPIYYSKFRDLGYLKELWQRIIGRPFDEGRAQQLMGMNIQRDVCDFFIQRPDIGQMAQKWLQ